MVLKTKPHTSATAKELEGYLDKTTGLTVGKWVDDLIVRGQKTEQDKFWDIMQKRFDIKSRGAAGDGLAWLRGG